MALMKNIFALSVLLAVFLVSAPLRAEQIETLAKQAIIVDYETGAMLFSKNPDEKMPTSSMSKVLTMYLVFEALQNGKLSQDDLLTVNEKAWRTQGSKMFVALNSRVKVSDLMRGVIVQSGNDATIVLAEGLAGTEEAFAEAMNRKAQDLGMKNSHFMNASGLPDPEHYSTCRDLATLARAMINNFPDYYEIYSEKDFTYNNIKQGNRNPLLYRNLGADGLKTGHTEGAGYGLIGTGVQDGRRVIIVLNGLSSMQERADESAKLLEWGQRRFENKTLAESGKTLDEASVAMGQAQTVPLVLEKDVRVTLPKMAQQAVKIQAVYRGPLVAPVRKGQAVGKLVIEMPGMEPIERPLLAGADVAELGFFAKTFEKARYLLGAK